MPRWAPDASGRLQLAAMELFLTHGYAEVTVADIAAEAGLTKRSFFNHFADKREVLFSGADAFEADLTAHIARADERLSPLDAAIWALTETGQGLAAYSEFAAARRQIISSSPELQERELAKTASTARVVTDGLIRREVPETEARLLAQVATTVFFSAFDEWIDSPGTMFSTHTEHVLLTLRAIITPGAPRPHGLRLAR